MTKKIIHVLIIALLILASSSIASSESAESLTRNLQVPGSAHLVFSENKVLSEGYYGFADEGRGAEVSSETLFYLHSLSKPILATTAVLLARDKKIDFDMKLSDALPEMRMHCQQANDPRCEITVRHLLTHTSGFDYPSALAGKRGNSDNYDQGFFFNPIGVGTSLDKSDSAIHADLAVSAELNHYPGEGFTYGISYDVLGYVLQEVAGVTLDILLNEYVFTPLGMQNTFFAPPDAKHKEVVRLYNRKYATYPIPGKYIRYQNYDADRVLITRDDYPISAGGGLIGTARDYVRFLQGIMSQFGGRLSEADRDFLYCSQVPDKLGPSPLQDAFFAADDWSYSFGFGVIPTEGADLCSNKLFWAGYSNNQFVVDLNKEVGEVFLTNLLPLDHNISIALDAVR